MRFIYFALLFLGLHIHFAFAEDNILSEFVDDDTPVLEDNFTGWNHLMHDINFFLDGALVTPVAKIYRRVLPKGVRESVGNFFGNLLEPYSAINNLLQGDTEQAGNNLRRFFINTGLGFGLFDLASDMGHEPDYEDFGQTLAVWGVGDGGYIVLPILGPNTIRSAFALAPDMLLDPMNIAIRDETDPTTLVVLQYAEVVNGRADNLDILEDLKSNSVDFYETIKSVYWQSRLGDIER